MTRLVHKIAASSLILTSALFAQQALATSHTGGTVGTGGTGGLSGATAQLEQAGTYVGAGVQKTLPEIIGGLVNQFLGLFGLILLGYFLYGGFLWMTASGDTEKVTTAKRVMTNAVIGVIIILLAFSISRFVLGALVGATTG